MYLIGVERVNFTAKDDGKKISGVNLYCAVPIDEDRGSGYRYSKKGFDAFFLSDYAIDRFLDGVLPKVGANIEVTFNREGRIAAVNFSNP